VTAEGRPRWLEGFFVAALLVALALLQRQIWFSRDSLAANARLAHRIRLLRTRLKDDRFRDDLLHAEVRNLERRRDALEAAVRYNLGYIRPGESYYRVMIVPRPRRGRRAPSAPSTHATSRPPRG
jgi:cell division protein FtsB